MPMVMLKLRPGVNTELTASLNEAGVSESNLIRYRNGLPEKLGGWAKFYDFAVGGVPKALHAWLDLNEAAYLGVGTTTLLGQISEDDDGERQLVDLTPQTFTSDFAPDFDTTNGSPNVVVDDPNIANVTVFDSVEFLTPVSVGGLILSGIYPIALNLGTTTYRIVAASNASALVTDGGAVPVFTTTQGNSQVSVLLEDHGLAVGGKINFPIETILNIDGNDNFTKALLHANGADASPTFTDSNVGGSAHTWTAAGNAQIDTAQFKFGGASGLFDGTGDYVTTPDHADFTLAALDWTWDCWFNCNAASGTIERIFGQCDNTGTAASTSIRGARLATDVIQCIASVGGSNFTVSSTSTFTNAVNTGWHHLAFVRTGNTLKLFIDGVQEGGDVAITGSINDSSEVWAFGTTGAITSDPWTGWLDEGRLSVGIARWTANFTPPVAEYGAEEASVSGTYTVSSVTDADNFIIPLDVEAGATGVTAMNGGDVRIVYHIALGPSAPSTGYGIGTYGSGAYGTGSAASSAQTGTPITSTDWALDNWGEILIACTEGGAVYYWQPNTGFQNARMISGNGAPPYNTGAFVSMQTQMLICYGSTDELDIGLDRDPLLVKWTDNAGDFTDFEIGTTSQAGSRRLSTGSKIVGGMSVAQQELLWTDLGLWSMKYLGSLQAGVWGFEQIGWSCGLIGKHAAARLGSNVFWMGDNNFFVLQGTGVSVMACSVWDRVFQDINTTYKHKCVAWANTPFNEVWFYYPRQSTSATEPDAYVKLNVLEGVWDYGVLDRSAAIDQSIVGMPIAASPAGIIYEHETSPDADGQALNASFTTGLFQLSDGLDIMMADWLLPDMKWQEVDSSTPASIQMTFRAYKYPGSTAVTYGPYTLSSTQQYQNLRIRARFISIEVESNDVGSWWRFGGPRVRVAPDGRL